MSECRRYFISGRVQGVFFRESTRREAMRLGLTGFARNLTDGRVEVLACGDKALLAELEQWLVNGPPEAGVDDVAGEAADDPAPDGFSVG